LDKVSRRSVTFTGGPETIHLPVKLFPVPSGQANRVVELTSQDGVAANRVWKIARIKSHVVVLSSLEQMSIPVALGPWDLRLAVRVNEFNALGGGERRIPDNPLRHQAHLTP
jgi:hypothetical protein